MTWNDMKETLIPKGKALGSTYVDRLMFEISEIEKQISINVFRSG